MQLHGQDFDSYEKHIFKSEFGELSYRLLLPKNYDENKAYPLIYFLHGAGERGSDNEKQLTHGGSYFLQDSIRDNYPAIVVFPQCPADSYWIGYSVKEKIDRGEEITFEGVFEEPIAEQKRLKALLEQIQLNYKIDENRQYIMGLSMGGLGLLEMITRWPNEFSAAISICGGGNLEASKAYADKVSVWLTHGDQDDVVPTELSRNLASHLDQLGSDVRYTEFKNINHNAWDPTFELADLMEWLFSKSKN